MTAEEIIKWYDGNPEAYFSDLDRTVDDLYRRHSMAQLKKDYRLITVPALEKVFRTNKGLYLPCFRQLQALNGPKRKSKRPDSECAQPKEICFNFLKVTEVFEK